MVIDQITDSMDRCFATGIQDLGSMLYVIFYGKVFNTGNTLLVDERVALKIRPCFFEKL